VKSKIPKFLLSPNNIDHINQKKPAKYNLPFIDRTLNKIAGFVKQNIYIHENSLKNAFFQRISSRVKLIYMLFTIIIIGISHNISSQIFLAVSIYFFVLISHLNTKRILFNAIISGFFFGVLISLPASLNLFSKGNIVLKVFAFSNPLNLFGYHIPQIIGFTDEGLILAVKFFLKVFNSFSISMLVINTTGFATLCKSMKMLKVPDIFIMILTMTYKYLTVLAITTGEMYIAMKARWFSKVNDNVTNEIIAGRIGQIFIRSKDKYEKSFSAMTARGFTGEVIIDCKDSVAFKDIVFLLFMLVFGVAVNYL